MDAKRLTGANAGSLKYDILTALSVYGLHAGPRVQISSSRMIGLITARYNWKLDEFCVGQRDLARMWNVTERTVKREIKFWLDQKLVICKRQGVRGRVGAYRINYLELYRATQPFWSRVGPDFEERMNATSPVQSNQVVAVDFSRKVSPIRAGSTSKAWQLICKRLQDMHPAQFQSWISQLEFVSENGEQVSLKAKSDFAAHYIQTHLITILKEAVEAILGPRRRIVILVHG